MRLRTPDDASLAAVIDAFADPGLRTGDSVKFQVTVDRLQLFDADTGQALVP